MNKFSGEDLKQSQEIEFNFEELIKEGEKHIDKIVETKLRNSYYNLIKFGYVFRAIEETYEDMIKDYQETSLIDKVCSIYKIAPEKNIIKIKHSDNSVYLFILNALNSIFIEKFEIEVKMDKNKFMDIVKQSYFINNDCETEESKEYYYLMLETLYDDFHDVSIKGHIHSIYLSTILIERFIRSICKINDLPLEKDNGELLTLGTLIKNIKTTNIFSKDIINYLNNILSNEKYGGLNLRNYVAHGILIDNHLYCNNTVSTLYNIILFLLLK